MRFTPRPLREEVNISREHPLKEFFLLAGGLLGGLLLVYLLLGWALDQVVPRIDPALEDRLGELMAPALTSEEDGPPGEARLQALLDGVVSVMEHPERTYRIHLLLEEEANAVALPGGHIIVLSGLVKEAVSENELTMILGHELGHYRDRDHLKGLGRGLVMVFLSSLLFGADSGLSRMTGSLLGGAETQFSQQQELEADIVGLELLVRRYGHAGGATDFYRRLARNEKGKELAYFFASHPYPEERVAALEELIRERDYPVNETVPLDEVLGAYHTDEVSP